jgi:signal peptide peptidase SppA
MQHAAFIGLETALQKHAANFHATGQKAERLTASSAKNRIARIVERPSADTAVVHIDGVIDKHISDFEMECYGGYDLRDLDAAIGAIANESEIQNVMLMVNSPGGTVTGVPESGARIAALASQKNVFAFTEGMCCSAAYWLASQADQIFSTASSDVGSIGVYLALLDMTEAMDKEGVAVNVMKSGDYKTMGAPFKKLTKEERAMFQAEVDHIGEMFRAAVTSKRPDVSDETMQGQSFFGGAALGVGLVDAILPDLSSALAHF